MLELHTQNYETNLQEIFLKANKIMEDLDMTSKSRTAKKQEIRNRTGFSGISVTIF